jgi:hypothetical protein
MFFHAGDKNMKENLSAEMRDIVESMAAIKGDAWTHAILVVFNISNCLRMTNDLEDDSASIEDSTLVKLVQLKVLEETIDCMIILLVPAVQHNKLLHKQKKTEFRKNLLSLMDKQKEYQEGKGK